MKRTTRLEEEEVVASDEDGVAATTSDEEDGASSSDTSSSLFSCDQSDLDSDSDCSDADTSPVAARATPDLSGLFDRVAPYVATHIGVRHVQMHKWRLRKYDVSESWLDVMWRDACVIQAAFLRNVEFDFVVDILLDLRGKLSRKFSATDRSAMSRELNWAVTVRYYHTKKTSPQDLWPFLYTTFGGAASQNGCQSWQDVANVALKYGVPKTHTDAMLEKVLRTGGL